VAFLLLPRDAGEDWPVVSARAIGAEGAFALQADRRDGARDVFVSSEGGATTLPGALETDAEAAMVRFDEAGQATRTFASGGSMLEVE
jgi:hypothetical protein